MNVTVTRFNLARRAGQDYNSNAPCRTRGRNGGTTPLALNLGTKCRKRPRYLLKRQNGGFQRRYGRFGKGKNV
jgi:hypothetical protein